jgi:site-specific DNA-cytosine methylase
MIHAFALLRFRQVDLRCGEKMKEYLKVAHEFNSLPSAWNVDMIMGGPPCQDFSTANPNRERYIWHLCLTFDEAFTDFLMCYG